MIIIDGPERAGKSTLTYVLEDLGYDTLHWGKVPSDAVYTPHLQAAIDACYNEGARVVWDRCWPSEAVYGKLMNRKDHRLTNDWWLGAFLHERAVDALGIKVMMLGPNDQVLESRRTADDLPVDVHSERAAFYRYAKTFGHWSIYREDIDTRKVAEALAYRDELARAEAVAHPKDCCGPLDARVLVLGEAASGHPVKVPGQWLVFTTPYMIQFARKLGNFAMLCRWTNEDVATPRMLSGIQTIVALGSRATTWAKRNGDGREVMEFPHPAYSFRWGQANKHVYDDLPLLLKGKL